MTEPATNVTLREMATTIFLKVIPATVAVVFLIKYGDRYFAERSIAVPSLLRGFVVIGLFMAIMRYAAGPTVAKFQRQIAEKGEIEK